MKNKIEERKGDKVKFRGKRIQERELLGRYTVKLLYKWDNKKFDEEYLKKLEKNWNRWKKDREEGEKKYMKKLEESLEWNEKDKQRSKRIWRDEKEVSLEVEP